MCASIGNRQPVAGGADNNFFVNRHGFGGEQFAQGFPPATVTGFFWAIRAGGNMYQTPGSASSINHLRLAIWAVNNNNPDALRGKTVNFEIPESSTPVQTVADLDAAVLMPSNTGFYVGPAFEYVDSGVSVSTDRRWQKKFYAGYLAHSRNVGATGPTNPFGTYSESISSGMVVWLEGQYNSAPQVPSGVSLDGVAIPSGSTGLDIVSTTPEITGLFRDNDEDLKDGVRTVFDIGEADKMSKYTITIRNATTNAIVQTTTQNATGAEQAARQFSWTPTALSPGKYLLHTRTYDLAGEASGISAHYFTVVAATVTTSGPPSGKITDTSPNSFGFTFNATGVSTYKVQLRILKNWVTIAATTEIDKVVAPGASGTITWAETGFSPIGYTGELLYQVRARYIAGTQQLTAWSEPKSFSINSPPSKPVNLYPNGQAFGIFPILQAIITDPDDTSASLSPFATVVRPDNTSTQFVMSTYAGSNTWKQGTHSGIVNQYGVYKWLVEASDAHGSLGPKSEYATFTYSPIPAVAITGVTPQTAGVVTVSSPTLAWTVEGTATPTSSQQASRHVLIYHAGTDDIAHERAFEATQATSYAVSGVLLKQGDYEAVIEVRNSSGVTGQSSRFAFTVEFEPPASLTTVNAPPIALSNDYPNQPTGVLLQWDESLLAPENFGRYEVARPNDSGELVTIGRIDNQQDSSFVDFTPPGNVTLDYAVRQIYTEAGDESASLDVMVTTSITIETLVLTDVVTGESVAIKSIAPDDYEEELIVDSAQLDTGTAAPTELRGVQEYTRISVAAVIHHTFEGTPNPISQTAMLRALAKQRVVGTTRVPRIICLRDGENRRLFGRIGDLTVQPRRLIGNSNVSFVFGERAYVEGVAGD